MTSRLCTRSAWPLRALAGAVLVSLCAFPSIATAQLADQVVNNGGSAVKYRLAGTHTWLFLQPGQSVVVDGQQYEFLNENSANGSLTTQRYVGTGYTTVFVITMGPGSQGTYESVGLVCTSGQWTVREYYYSNQYIGNIYARCILSLISAPARGDFTPAAYQPVITVWGYGAYNGGSRMAATTFDNSRSGSNITLVGSSDPTCGTQSYFIDAQGEYINWDDFGRVTARTMPCALYGAAPALSPAGLVLLLGALAGVAIVARRRRRAA